ncbi:restriction endonuclease subunit S [Vibrio profundi]|uniref:restriction endonuclease subunit S n=1 Tax=Vibrio profundi TaxID=1774960 RepID=UPI0037367AF2
MSFELHIPEGWSQVKLSDLGEVNRGRSRHRPRDAAHLYGGPYPFVQTGDVKASKGRVTQHSQTYSEEGLAQSRLWPKGTMCITIAANIAETGILTYPACFPDSVIGFIADESKCNVYFIEYVFRLLRKRIQAQATGSVQDNINLQTLERLLFPIPALEEQNRIAAVLGELDDKIHLNDEINQTLEQMAQAIFKSWFVDFDPVKAKMSGEQPEGMNATTASLFPEKLVESELGLIPNGWEVKPFSEWVKITKGKNITKKTIVEGDVPVVAGGLKPAYFHNAHNVNGPAITISASGANAGYVNLYFENIWASDCSYISQSTTPLFFLQYVALRYNQKKIFDMQTGAAQPHIYPRDFERLMIAVPNEELCRKLEDVFASFFGTIANNKQQNIELAALRDTLLPKLLSGEIDLDTQEVKCE